MGTEKSYHTKQKDILLTLFKTEPDRCFTSKEIIENKTLGLSEATVYRLISQFVKDGTVKKFKDEKGSLYQFNHCSGCLHFHMKCLECGELYHIDSPMLKSVEDSIAENYGFYVDNTNTTLYGYCRDCRKDSK